MDEGPHIFIANDNEPTNRFPRGDAIGFRSLIVDRQRQYFQQHNTNILHDLQSEIKTSHLSFGLSLLCWLGAITVFFWSFITIQSIGMRLLAATALIWTALWTVYLTRDHYKPRIGELAVLTALAGFISAFLTAAIYLGFPLELSSGFCLFSLIALLVATLIGSRMALMASISASLLWAGLYMEAYLTPSLSLLCIPAILSTQILLAGYFKSNISIAAAVGVLYIWLVGFTYQAYSQTLLSPLHLVGGLFIIAGVHYHSAMAAEEEQVGYMQPHIFLAWGLGMIALLSLQHYLFYPDERPWALRIHTAPLIKIAWAALILVGLSLIALAGLIRRRTGHISLSSILCLILVYSLIPLAIIYETPIQFELTQYTGLNIHEWMGQCLAGIIFGSAFIFTLRNMRARRYILCALGLVIIAVEADLSLKSEFMSKAGMIMLIIGLVSSIAVLSLVKSITFEPFKPKLPLQHLRHL